MNKYIIRYTENNKPFIDSEDYNKKLVCEICGQRVVNNNGLASHIRRTHKMKPKEYYDKYLKKDGEGICPVCGRQYRLKRRENVPDARLALGQTQRFRFRMDSIAQLLPRLQSGMENQRRHRACLQSTQPLSTPVTAVR